ncbi:F-box/kelch-repeat protein At3g06240-like isoform X2 [Tripterygium wilfordii]|uniref:F-box/kelch-repeat protein At3g06240-like isoform X1 n=1 Tax=Tripterygium wilfordii TaxID=458696 RepID=UPI0018F81F8D|nr:F-box/kelch-repeat protein At3g06240-like isoform X1 [Tripterygium wilfordii]XP_038699962.1 F-box/kelch-repeat protein At3g06240-like isoform X2 [Tripterygium wilfordii]
MACLSIFFPEDLVIDIVAGLPVKSLKRFRCVSRPWCNLIGNPNFVSKHHRKQIILDEGIGTVFVTYNDEVNNYEATITTLKLDCGNTIPLSETIPMPTLHGSNDGCCKCFAVCGPINGILCVYERWPKCEDIILWNPATKEMKTLPLTNLKPVSTFLDSYGDIGFGFDHRTKDYKVLRFASYPSASIDQVELFSLESDSWRVIPIVDVFPRFGAYHIYNTYKDGVSYWLGAGVSYRDPVSDPQCILSFDMANEVFEKLPLPSNLEMSGFSVLDFMNENLSLVLCPDEDMEKCFDIWVMTQHGVKESWVKQVSIGRMADCFWQMMRGSWSCMTALPNS